MASPAGTLVDLNVIQKRLGRLKSLLQRNEVADYKTLSADILADLTDIDTLIQASTNNLDLSESPTLSLTENP